MTHRFYVTLDSPSGRPDLLFRTPAGGGPPTEKWVDGRWVEDVSLIDYFLGDASGAYEIPAEAVPEASRLLA